MSAPYPPNKAVRGNPIDMANARAMANASAAGQPSDNDADDGTPVGGWTNNEDGIDQGSANGVNAASRPASNPTGSQTAANFRPHSASTANQIGPGHGRYP